MVVQSAAGPDLGGIVTAPRLLCKKHDMNASAVEINQWLQTQRTCV